MNIHGLFDNKKNTKKDENDNKNRTTYAGGNKSGIAVEDNLDKIVNKAKENSSKGDPNAQPKGEPKIKITLFSNGFRINDGEFKDYSNEENKKFLQELEKGYIPNSLRSQFPNDKDLSVGLEDKRNEEYVPPPPPKYTEFQGKGINMGNSGAILMDNIDSNNIECDDSKPFGEIQIRFANGKKKVIKVNYSYKIGDLYDYITISCPLETGFDLVTGFPPTVLDNISLTVQEANLIGSVVTQKPI